MNKSFDLPPITLVCDVNYIFGNKKYHITEEVSLNSEDINYLDFTKSKEEIILTLLSVPKVGSKVLQTIFETHGESAIENEGLDNVSIHPVQLIIPDISTLNNSIN